MRLKQYINESKVISYNNVGEFNKSINQDCRDYFKLIKSHDPLYRGMEIDEIDLGKNFTRKNRMPRGMTKKTSNKLNKLLKKNGHLERKDVVFCIGKDSSHLSYFGDIYYIFPKGKLQYTWFASRDVNLNDDRVGGSNYDEFIMRWLFQISFREDTIVSPYVASFLKTPVEELQKLSADELHRKVEKKFLSMFHTNEGIDIAIKNGYEIWIKCKEYYFANSSYDYDPKTHTVFY